MAALARAFGRLVFETRSSALLAWPHQSHGYTPSAHDLALRAKMRGVSSTHSRALSAANA